MPNQGRGVYSDYVGDDLVVYDATGAEIGRWNGGGSLIVDGKDVGALLALLSALPIVDVASPGIWNDNGVLKVGTDT